MTVAGRPSRYIGLVVEGPDDHRAVRALIDRLLLEIDWVHQTIIDSLWLPVSADDTSSYLAWRFVHTRWSELRDLPHELSLFGDFHGHSEPDELAARKALVMMVLREPTVDAVVLVRDTDDARDGAGLRAAVASRPWPFGIAVGLADPRVEAWFLAAYEPQDEREQSALVAQEALLKFDPRTEADRLRSRETSHDRNPKTVVDALGGVERGAAGLSRTEWAILTARDRHGLMAFVQELRTHVVTLFDPTPRLTP